MIRAADPEIGLAMCGASGASRTVGHPSVIDYVPYYLSTMIQYPYHMYYCTYSIHKITACVRTVRNQAPDIEVIMYAV